MQNKIERIKRCFFLATALMTLCAIPAMADAIDEELQAEEISANAIAEYEAEGTLFQKIADLEQQKVLMQLEKERAQLDLELDRLVAEKIKLHMEIDTLSGRAEEQQLALETERAKLETEAAKLEKEKQALMTQPAESAAQVKKVTTSKAVQEEKTSESIGKKYRLVDIIGVGNQLQATVENTENGQNKKISVGKSFDNYTVRSISLDDGITFVKDGIVETLNISKEK
jgi:type IV pilus biogenesis protein PilP